MSCRCRNINTEIEKKSQTTVQKENIRNISEDKLKNISNTSGKKNISVAIKSPVKNTSNINEKIASSIQNTMHRIPLSDLKSENCKPKVNVSKKTAGNSVLINSKTGLHSINTCTKTSLPINNINIPGACKCGPRKSVATNKNVTSSQIPKTLSTISEVSNTLGRNVQTINSNNKTEKSKCTVSSTVDNKVLSSASVAKCDTYSKSETNNNNIIKKTSTKKNVSYASTSTNNKKTLIQLTSTTNSGVLNKIEEKVNLEKSLSNSKLPVYKCKSDNKICSGIATTKLDPSPKKKAVSKAQTNIKRSIPVKTDKNTDNKSKTSPNVEIKSKITNTESNQQNISPILAHNISSNKSASIIPISTAESKNKIPNLDTTVKMKQKSKKTVHRILFKSPIKSSSPYLFTSLVNSTKNNSFKPNLTPGISTKNHATAETKKNHMSDSYTEASTAIITSSGTGNKTAKIQKIPLASSTLRTEDLDISCIKVNSNNNQSASISNTKVDEFWQTFEILLFNLPKSDQQQNINRFIPVYYKNKDELIGSKTYSILETSVFDGVPALTKKSLTTPKEQTRNHFGVVDLDLHTHKVHPLLLYGTDLMNDIIRNIMLLQRENILRSDVLDNNTRLSDYRTSLVDWLVKLHEHLAPNTNTFFMAVRLFDKIISINNISESLYQILIMTTYWISLKYNNNNEFITASRLLKLCHDRFTVQQLLMTEKKALDILKYNLSVDDPMIFVYYYIYIMQIPESKVIAFCANYFLEILALEHSCNRFPLSLQAASAVYLSLRLFKCDEKIWDMLIDHYGYHRLCEMYVIHKIILKNTTLLHEDTYPYKESYKKYSNEKYEQVSLKVSKILLEISG